MLSADGQAGTWDVPTILTDLSDLDLAGVLPMHSARAPADDLAFPASATKPPVSVSMPCFMHCIRPSSMRRAVLPPAPDALRDELLERR